VGRRGPSEDGRAEGDDRRSARSLGGAAGGTSGRAPGAATSVDEVQPLRARV